MRGKYQVIARYTDGVAKFWIGRKQDRDLPLGDDNIEWLMEGKTPAVFDEYQDADERMKAS